MFENHQLESIRKEWEKDKWKLTFCRIVIVVLRLAAHDSDKTQKHHSGPHDSAQIRQVQTYTQTTSKRMLLSKASLVILLTLLTNINT